MRGSKKLTAGLLIALLAVAWACCFLGVLDAVDAKSDEGTSYDLSISQAEDYMQRGLYQKAIAAYTDAVKEENREEDWASLLAAYQARYEEDVSIREDYIASAKKAAAAYGDNIDFYKTLASLCVEDEDYSAAYRYLTQAIGAGVEDEALLALYQEVRYAFSLGNTDYSSVGALCNGGYIAQYGGYYGQLSGTGKTLVRFRYDLLGGLGEDGVFVFASGEEAGLMDTDGVLQGKLNFVPAAAGVYSEGLVPISDSKSWSYYNLLGDWQFGGYLSAGSFDGGLAAVETEKGWQLIDTTGKAMSPRYEEIRLNGDGSYLSCGLMLAKESGQWHLYDREQNRIGSFACDDIDIVTEDGMIAFAQSGAWGFADTEGNILLQPTYTQARSFSNGLAAVCVEDRWGFITSDGTLVMDAQWLDAGYFSSSGTCYVQTAEDSWTLLSRKITE